VISSILNPCRQAGLGRREHPTTDQVLPHSRESRRSGVPAGTALALTLESIRQREEHWGIADLVGKDRHVRTANPTVGQVRGRRVDNRQKRYLGCKQKLRSAVNKRLGIEPDAA
jgi:hypothetical protein